MASDLPTLPQIDRSDDFELFTLSDGRGLAFMEWGDPGGFPAFYFHGTPSSRLEGAFADAAARREGVSPDRNRPSRLRPLRLSAWPPLRRLAPGYLRSRRSPRSHRLRCRRPLRRGTASLCLWRLYGARASQVHRGARTLGTARGAGDLGQSQPARSVLRGSRTSPAWSLRVAFAPLGWGARYWPDLFFKVMAASVSTADKAALRNPAFREHFGRMEREAFLQGSRGPAQEALMAIVPGVSTSRLYRFRYTFGWAKRMSSYPTRWGNTSNGRFPMSNSACPQEGAFQHRELGRYFGGLRRRIVVVS